MKHIFSKRIAKIIVDILLLIGLVLSIKTGRTACNSWGSLHCIVSMVWYVLMLVHIWQHWGITKAMLKWNVMKRNIVTAITFLVFILMTLNIIVFVFKVNETLVNLHHTIAHIFWAVIILHTLTKTKRFFQLFKKPKNER
jgi:EamA domain-containing membrane protein RarD